ERLQLQFYTSSDFSGPLHRFSEDTRKNSQIGICSRVRNELVTRFQGRMAEQTLIQTAVRLYLSTQLPKFVTEAGRNVRGFDDVFKVLRRSCAQRQQFFDLLLRAYGGEVRQLENTGHYAELLRF